MVVTVGGAKSDGILMHSEGQTNGSDGYYEITPQPARNEMRKRNKTALLSLNAVLRGYSLPLNVPQFITHSH